MFSCKLVVQPHENYLTSVGLRFRIWESRKPDEMEQVRRLPSSPALPLTPWCLWAHPGASPNGTVTTRVTQILATSHVRSNEEMNVKMERSSTNKSAEPHSPKSLPDGTSPSFTHSLTHSSIHSFTEYFECRLCAPPCARPQ